MVLQGWEPRQMVELPAKDAQMRAQLALSKSPIYVLRDIQVEQVDGALLLVGRVDTFYHKQLAQEVVRAASNGIRVVNSLDVE